MGASGLSFLLREADNAVAYPRVAMDGWTPFVGSARAVFESCWRELLPSGVRDLTTRWVRTRRSRGGVLAGARSVDSNAWVAERARAHVFEV